MFALLALRSARASLRSLDSVSCAESFLGLLVAFLLLLYEFSKRPDELPFSCGFSRHLGYARIDNRLF